MLTEDITRLCGDILELRNKRGEMMAQMDTHNKAMKQSVADLCVQFTSLRAEMARKTKTDRARFLNGLRHVVHSQMHEMQTDLAGARRAWAGTGK